MKKIEIELGNNLRQAFDDYVLKAWFGDTMKRKINFTITVGSHWPEKDYPAQMVTPVDGEMTTKVIEFETDNRDPFKDACNALAQEMTGQTYHIWYWSWLDAR